MAINLKEVAENDHLLEVGRRAVEEALIEFRDSRLSEPFRGNGLVIKEKDGTESSIIRFGSESALRIGLKAMHEELQKLKENING